MDNPTTISLETIQLPNNIVRTDVYVKNAPAHFLGLAFELNIEGQIWGLQKYELGSVFKKPSELLVLATKRDEPKPRIVFGLSYKGKTLINKEKTTPDDGKMISFYLQTPTANPLKFTFSENVISVYEKGRKDLQSAIWTNKDVYLKPFAKQSLKQKEAIIAQKIPQSEKKPAEKAINQPDQSLKPSLLGESFLPMEKSVEPMTVAETYQANTFKPDQSLTHIYLVLGTVFVLFVLTLIVTAFVFVFRKNKT